MTPPGYVVTRDGRVKGPSGKWLVFDVRDNHARVSISNGSGHRKVPVALLVCEEFHGPAPTPEHVPVHIDGNALNNHADNLRWGTKKEAKSALTPDEYPSIQGESHPLAVLTWKEVYAIRKEYAAGGVTQKVLGLKFGVSQVTIHNIVNNKIWKVEK